MIWWQAKQKCLLQPNKLCEDQQLTVTNLFILSQCEIPHDYCDHAHSGWTFSRKTAVQAMMQTIHRAILTNTIFRHTSGMSIMLIKQPFGFRINLPSMMVAKTGANRQPKIIATTRSPIVSPAIPFTELEIDPLMSIFSLFM